MLKDQRNDKQVLWSWRKEETEGVNYHANLGCS